MTPLREESSVLQTLRISLHVMFAFLLAVGYFSAFRDNSHLALLTVSTLILGLVYLAGTIVENRFTHGKLGGSLGANIVKVKPGVAWLWLVIIVTMWGGLLLQDLSFTWLMFPLVFLCMHLLSLFPALFLIVALTVFSILWSNLHLNSLSAGSIIGPAMGALLAVIISLAYRQLHHDSQMHRHTAEKLRATRAELAQKEHEAGRLEERERLAREIHDTLAQGLSSIVLISRAASSSTNLSEINSQVQVINRVAADNLAEARRFIRNLSSASLSTSLVPALQRLCSETRHQMVARGDSLNCIFRLDGEGITDEPEPSSSDQASLAANDLPPQVQETIFRVAQGSLANVAAHAQAQNVVLTLGLWKKVTTLDIYDDGRGFIPPSADIFPAQESKGKLVENLMTNPRTSDGYGYGLISLYARAAAIGAQLTVESSPGEGAVVTLTIPHHQKEQKAL